MLVYRFLDVFFLIFHTFLILFNLFGWIWKKTRKLNLTFLTITGCSWLILGMIVGTLGYCPLTDWHFRILEKLGSTELPWSYVKYLADRLTGLNFDPVIIDRLTLYIFILAFVISLTINTRDILRKNFSQH